MPQPSPSSRSLAMPDISSNNAKVTKQRTKTFTGCWTCRDRRVKCDEEHPHCRRCQRNGWVCKGYGLRLGWSQTPGGRSHRRQLRSPLPDADHGLSSAAVTALLVELDGCSADDCAQQRGPFSVFSVSSSPEMQDSGHPNLPNLEDAPLTPNAEDTQRISLDLINSSVGDRDSELAASPRATSGELSSAVAPSTSGFHEDSCPVLPMPNNRVDDISINAIPHVLNHKKPPNKLSGQSNHGRSVSNIQRHGTEISQIGRAHV